MRQEPSQEIWNAVDSRTELCSLTMGRIMIRYAMVGDARVRNSPTSPALEAGPGWPVLVMAMTGPE